MSSIHKFFSDAYSRAERTGERKGQAVFNHLHSVREELAEKIRGTDKDPFYAENTADPQWENFLKFIWEEWDKTLIVS